MRPVNKLKVILSIISLLLGLVGLGVIFERGMPYYFSLPLGVIFSSMIAIGGILCLRYMGRLIFGDYDDDFDDDDDEEETLLNIKNQ